MSKNVCEFKTSYVCIVFSVKHKRPCETQASVTKSLTFARVKHERHGQKVSQAIHF